jgi:hypothetical protein
VSWACPRRDASRNDASQNRDLNFRGATSPNYPKTIHYRGDGEFMISGANTSRYRKLFKPQML